MRLSRRRALGLGTAGAIGLLTGRVVLAEKSRVTAARIKVSVRAVPIPALLPADPARRRFGSLTFRSGLVLSSDERSFGGLSALWRSPDGERIVSLTDHGAWLTARLVSEDGRLRGLADAEMAPMLFADEPRFGRVDSESFALGDGIAFVGVEETNEVLRFEWARDGVNARGEPIPVPVEVKNLPENKGLEALGIAPPGHPLAGALIGIAERAREGGDTPTRGFILTGPIQGAFDVVRNDAFEVTDLTFLPSGEMLLLQRYYTPQFGVKCRLKRIAPDAIRSGALVDGPTIFEADKAHEIDNMEGITTHRDASETIVTMISDDNFSPTQRTVLLEFALDER